MLFNRIFWGDYKYKPSFWPEDIAPWGLITNPNTAQKHKLKFPFVEILKIAVYRCLMSKGIDPRSHVKEDVCQKQIRNKLRTRSLKTIDEAYERFFSTYRLFLLKPEPEEAKYVPDESYDPLESFEKEEASEKNEVTDGETFEDSDDDNMSDDDDDVYSDSGKDRAAAIENILNILAND